jgi:isopentenyl-diphosphate Delta-isomerase
MKEPFVILVDENDMQTGISGKMEAHKKALLHRAVSVFVVNNEGKWILQRRALDKYHSNGLWTNTCCTHPHPGETNIGAAMRRLKEEMGIECSLVELFSFTYIEKLDNGLTEHEFDHVFCGISDKDPVINTTEVEEWKTVSFEDLHADILENHADYTYWFKKIYEKVEMHITEIQKTRKYKK